LTTEAKFSDQRNFEFDFEAPDVPTIMDLRVTVQAHHPIHTALLFVRHRFYASKLEEREAQPLQPRPVREEDAVPALSPERDRQVPGEAKKPAPWDEQNPPNSPLQTGTSPQRRRRLE